MAAISCKIRGRPGNSTNSKNSKNPDSGEWGTCPTAGHGPSALRPSPTAMLPHPAMTHPATMTLAANFGREPRPRTPFQGEDDEISKTSLALGRKSLKMVLKTGAPGDLRRLKELKGDPNPDFWNFLNLLNFQVCPGFLHDMAAIRNF